MRRLSRREVPFAREEKTYGLKVFVEEWRDDAGQVKRFWKYGLPDGVQVLGFTAGGDVIAIEEWQPTVGRYIHLVGGTMKPGENPLDVAGRELREETGYETGSLELLSAVLENSGRSDRLIHLVLATDCVLTAAPGAGITVCLFKPADFWAALMRYYRTDPAVPHAGGNSLKVAALAFSKLGYFTLTTPV